MLCSTSLHHWQERLSRIKCGLIEQVFKQVQYGRHLSVLVYILTTELLLINFLEYNEASEANGSVVPAIESSSPVIDGFVLQGSSSPVNESNSPANRSSTSSMTYTCNSSFAESLSNTSIDETLFSLCGHTEKDWE